MADRPSVVASVSTMVPGNQGSIVETQWAPPDIAATQAPADPGRAPHRSRRPVPAERAREAPATVVERRPAPGLVGHPRPAVGRPGPAAVRVGRPAHGDPGLPDVADGLLVPPAAVVVELRSVGSQLLREVAPAVGGPCLTRLEVGVPEREVVLGNAIERLGRRRSVAIARRRPLACREPHPVAARVECDLALVDGKPSLAALHVDADDARDRDLDQPPGGFDLEDRGPGGPRAQNQAPGPETQHDALVPALVVGGVVELAPAVEAHDRPFGELELSPARSVGPDPIAGEEGQVGHRFLRRDLGSALHADTRFDVSDEPVWVAFLSGCRGRGQTGRGDGQARQSECQWPHECPPSGSPRGSCSPVLAKAVPAVPRV